MITINQAILIIVTLVFSTGFLVLIIAIVPMFKELKNLLIELQKTSKQVNALAEDLKKITSNVEGKLEGFDSIIANSQKFASNISDVLNKLNLKIGGHKEMLAIVPAIIWGWRIISKFRRRKYEQGQ